MYLRTNKLKRN